MSFYGIPDNPGLTTHSRLRAWWLQGVCGYTMLDVQRQPRAGWFGRLAYDETFLLMPKKLMKH